MLSKLLLVCLFVFGVGCGDDNPMPEGVYRIYFALTETNVPGEQPWAAGVVSSPTFWSLKTVKNQKGRWLRWRLFPEGLQENKHKGTYFYCSLDWSEWGLADTNVCLEVKPREDGFVGKMNWNTPEGERVYSLGSTWICDNGVGIGCGDWFW